MEEYIIKNNKKLRMGYTTGSCATAAAKAAALMLLKDVDIHNVKITTPSGIDLNLELVEIKKGPNFVECGIIKDSGDDPDVTNGITIYSKVEKISGNEIIIDGGIGIGRVTKKGLDQEVGKAAINSTPRKTIKEEVEKVLNDSDYKGGLLITISAPKGVELANKTFNPKLGIVGGISILGTSGIVYPMSEEAILDTIKTEMRMIDANNINKLLITPGNYAEDYIKENLSIDTTHLIKCSNFIGETIEYANQLNFKKILLVGHIGKMVKLAGGIMNTHSKYGECRNEIFAAHAAMYGMKKENIQEIMSSAMTDDMIDILDRENLRDLVLKDILNKIIDNINTKAHNNLPIDIIVFSNKYGLLVSNTTIDKINKEW